MVIMIIDHNNIKDLQNGYDFEDLFIDDEEDYQLQINFSEFEKNGVSNKPLAILVKRCYNRHFTINVKIDAETTLYVLRKYMDKTASRLMFTLNLNDKNYKYTIGDETVYNKSHLNLNEGSELILDPRKHVIKVLNLSEANEALFKLNRTL